MRLTQFDMELLCYMGNYESVKLDAGAEYLGISEKTLRNRLNDLMDILQEYNIRLDFSAGGVIRIQGREHFARLLKENSLRYEMPFDKKFLLLMALHTDYLVIQDIADRLLVSKSYAEKKISRILKEYREELHSQRHYGIQYGASAQQRFSRIVQILFPYIIGNDFRTSLIQFHKLHLPILDYFSDEHLNKAEQAIKLISSMEWFSFTDESIQMLYLYILLFLRFGSRFLNIQIGNYFLREVKKQNRDDILGWISEFSRQLDMDMSEETAGYLGYLFLTLRKQKIKFQDQIEEKLTPVLEEIFRKIKKWLSFDISEDNLLSQGLAVHIYTTIMRKNLWKTEPDLYAMGEIKRQYPLAFEMAVITADYISDMYNLYIEEKNLLYLVMHYQAAIERLNDKHQKARIIVVCHFGMAGANIIRSKIERKLSGAEVVNLCSLQELLREEQPEYDFIVTTEPILKIDKPVLYVSLAFPERELKKIEDYIQNIQISRKLFILLMEAIIIPIKKAHDQCEVIREMSAVLEKSGAVLPEYADSAEEREKLSSTGLFYIAMPHGNPALVKHTKLAIARMDSPVLWEDAKVICAFLLAASLEVLKTDPLLFSVFYRKLSDPDAEEQIRQLQTEQNFSDEEFRKKLIQILDVFDE